MVKIAWHSWLLYLTFSVIDFYTVFTNFASILTLFTISTTIFIIFQPILTIFGPIFAPNYDFFVDFIDFENFCTHFICFSLNFNNLWTNFCAVPMILTILCAIPSAWHSGLQ